MFLSMERALKARMICSGLFVISMGLASAASGVVRDPTVHLDKRERAVIGQLEAVDPPRGLVTVKVTAKVKEIFAFDRATQIRGISHVEGVPELMREEEDAFVLVHYSMLGTRKFARSIEYLGRRALKIATGTLVSIDKGGGPILLRTPDGEESFLMAERMTIEHRGGIQPLKAFNPRIGETLTAYYSETVLKHVHLLRYDMAD
jgi:hypothetical protein